MDEGTCLENRHTFRAYRGFESRPLRQINAFPHRPLFIFESATVRPALQYPADNNHTEPIYEDPRVSG